VPDLYKRLVHDPRAVDAQMRTLILQGLSCQNLNPAKLRMLSLMKTQFIHFRPSESRQMLTNQLIISYPKPLPRLRRTKINLKHPVAQYRDHKILPLPLTQPANPFIPPIIPPPPLLHLQTLALPKGGIKSPAAGGKHADEGAEG